MARQPRRIGWFAGLRLLVVDGDASAEVVTTLRSAGMAISALSRGSDALIEFGHTKPHAVLLSPSLPDIPAGEVVAAMRRSGAAPILVGVGPGDADLVGPVFMAGATAAVSRPYNPGAIVQSLARELPLLPVDEPVTFGPLRLDARARTVHVWERLLGHLPLKEFECLRLLMTYADRVVTIDEIKAVAWSNAPRPTNNSVAVHIQRLRKRLPDGVTVLMVRGVGYRLAAREMTGPQGPRTFAGQLP